MSLVNKSHWQIANQLRLGNISENGFCSSLGTTVDQVSDYALDLLRRGFDSQDSGAVGFALFIGHHFGFEDEWLEVLLWLAEADWHTRHEDVVGGLARLLDPKAVDVLYRLALRHFAYRDYDDSSSLGVKCIWALRKTETPEAVARLGDLMASGNRVLEECAKKRLLDLQADTKLRVELRQQSAAILASRPDPG